MWLRRSSPLRLVHVLVGTLVVTSACSVGPDYVRPTVDVPAAYKELGAWKVAEPRDDVARGAWWDVYDDPELGQLEARVTASNQDLAAAEARFREARATVGVARADWWPTVTIGVSVTRSHQVAAPGAAASSGRTTNNYAMPIEASWEADVWGRIRRNVESTEASAQASAADLESTRLSLQATLAIDYFQLHTFDAERRLLDESVAAFERSLAITQSRFGHGVASRADVAQAQAQLESTRAQAVDVGLQRAQVEHAIAVLVGTPAAELSLPPVPLAAAPPTVPVGLPSALLERRPDVAVAERGAAAANAQIGVADAAYYPTVTLSASGGFSNTDAASWLAWPSRFWSFGPSVTETVFDGGRRGALSERARATYDEAVATYRQRVLGAFQNVEDELAALRLLDDESRVQAGAVAAAEESLRLTQRQYQAGTVSYLDVVTTQTTALTNERTAVDLLGRRMVASVALIEALGGGWTADTLLSRGGSAGAG